MTNAWFTLIVGLIVCIWGGAALFREKILAWSKASIKLIALVGVIFGAYLIYVAISLL